MGSSLCAAERHAGPRPVLVQPRLHQANAMRSLNQLIVHAVSSPLQRDHPNYSVAKKRLEVLQV